MKDKTLKQHEPTITREKAAEKLQKWADHNRMGKVDPSEFVYCSWVETFGSTAGPFKGVGGCAMTSFRMEAWYWEGWGVGVVFCGGKVVQVGYFSISANYKQ